MAPLARDSSALLADVLGPARLPRRPLALARLGLPGLLPATVLARTAFEAPRARALLAGLSAHSILPLERSPSGAFGLVLGLLGHAVGWPLPRGGAQRIADALATTLRSLGGTIETGRRIEQLAELPRSRQVILDVSPRALARIGGARLPERYRRRLARYRFGPGVFKLDWALAGPIPWLAPECARAATVHLGGTLEEIAAAEQAAWSGRTSTRPFVLLAQPTLFDSTRAPDGRHIAWAYCHVPNGSAGNLTGAIEAQVERFAPGFRDLVLGRSCWAPADFERHDPNYVGGDVNCGVQDLRQLFTRPVARLDPYATPAEGLYLCSSATPPGGGVHGMCGYHAARSALSGSGTVPASTRAPRH
jgi:phytoene dehydrogenase-like protein